MYRTLKSPDWFRRLDMVRNKSVLLGVSFVAIYLGMILLLTWSGWE